MSAKPEQPTLTAQRNQTPFERFKAALSKVYQSRSLPLRVVACAG